MFSFAINSLKNLPEKLQRITSGGKLIREIDGLRFIAILPVVIQHLAERLHKYSEISFIQSPGEDLFAYTLSRGFVGVNVFYLISGFVLGLPFASHYLKNTPKVELGKYFVRRVTRLEPPYFILMTAFFFVLVIVQSADIRAMLPHYLASIFYLHNIIYQLPSPINPVAWTLEIEIQFYILAPLLTMLFFSIPAHTLRRSILIGATVLIITLQQITGFSVVPGAMTILGQVHYFLAGFLIADLFLIHWSTVKDLNKTYWFDLLAFAAVFGIVYGKSPDLINRLFFISCLVCFFIGAFRGKILNRFVTNRWVTAIGGMCYTIYLIHLPFIELFIRVTKGLTLTSYFSVNFLLQAIICLPILLIISIVVFLAIEKPCMDKNWPSRLKLKTRLFWNLAKARLL